MKTFFTVFLTAMISMFMVLFATYVLAFEPPKPTGYVMDMAGKLSPDQIAQLNSKLEGMNKSTKNEFAALIVPTMNGESVEDVAHTTFKTWHVGKSGLDNGVLVVIAVAERKSRIETGKGVEGDLTDLQANDILKRSLNPFLKKGDFYGGLNATFDAISSTIESRANVSSPPSASSSKSAPLGLIFGIGGAILAMFVLGFKILSGGETSRRKVSSKKYPTDDQIQKIQNDFQASRDTERQKMLDAKRRMSELKRINEETARNLRNAQPKPLSRGGVEVISVVRKAPYVETKPKGNAAEDILEQKRIQRSEEESNRRRREQRAREEESSRRRQRDEEDRRQRDEDDRRRRNDDSGFGGGFGSSSGGFGGFGGSDSGFGGFGGGSSGGGGSSSDW